ncbi:serine/threonine-protein kinase LMTK1 isoform X2 [Dasypus novemcinctus]|uniref:serine/threonine-protein kinase LMTK1 isoform X2 n=1 Tax=Dasypus novemcinctus TaxID=9361 RepID=UPI00265D92B3|nr:serine/threonine-protein kinase LMTK1 isoform X2 [Dasypus novemcinctus]
MGGTGQAAPSARGLPPAHVQPAAPGHSHAPLGGGGQAPVPRGGGAPVPHSLGGRSLCTGAQRPQMHFGGLSIGATCSPGGPTPAPTLGRQPETHHPPHAMSQLEAAGDPALGAQSIVGGCGPRRGASSWPPSGALDQSCRAHGEGGPWRRRPRRGPAAAPPTHAPSRPENSVPGTFQRQRAARPRGRLPERRWGAAGSHAHAGLPAGPRRRARPGAPRAACPGVRECRGGRVRGRRLGPGVPGGRGAQRARRVHPAAHRGLPAHGQAAGALSPAPQVRRPGPAQPPLPEGDRPRLVREGVPGRGALGRRQRAGGGEGADGQRQRAGAGAVPGGGAALQGPAAHQPAPVPGPVRGGDPLPAGHGVLPAGGPQGLPAELPGGRGGGARPADLAAHGLRGGLRRPAPAQPQLRAQRPGPAELPAGGRPDGEDRRLRAVPLQIQGGLPGDGRPAVGAAALDRARARGRGARQPARGGPDQGQQRVVLAYAVREQQLKLPKPQLPLPLSDRWYEVMQFCWLQPEQRPTAEEVHLLLSYLCAKGATEAEEEFERRWRSLRPSGGGPGAAGPAELAVASSFPLLEQFSGDGFHADGEDVLTVTETSHGLNFECKWEASRGAEAFPPPSPGRAARLQELCALDGAPPGVVPVLSAHSPSVGSEYFIRLEEPAAGHDPDCAGCTRGPGPTALSPDGDDDSEGSAATSLGTEPLLGAAAPADSPWGRSGDSPCRGRAREPACPSSSPSPRALTLAELGAEDSDWGAAAFCPAFEDPLGASPSGGWVLSPGREGPREAEVRRATQHRHWHSNASANNNSASRHRGPGPWGLGYMDSCVGCLPSPDHVPQTWPGHPRTLTDPGELPPGPHVASPGQEPGHCLPLCPAGGPAPVSCPIVSPGAEAAVGGDGDVGAEPRLAGEAGPQPPPPSVPSPSREVAPLPAEEAGALASLPALPTPAASGRADAAPDLALNSGGSSPELEAAGSEDEDTTEATSGVFTNLSSDGPLADKPDAPASRSLQKQVGTPDSLDSLDIPSSASDGEACSPTAAGTPGGQPRAPDSGYDTENYESPEFVLKEAHEPETLGEVVPEGEGPGPQTLRSAPLGGLSEKNPYRDSAYFSDLEAEPETPSGAQEKQGRVCSPGPEPGLDPESPQSPGLRPAPTSPGPGAPLEAPLPPSPEAPSPEPSACLVRPGPESPGSPEGTPARSAGCAKCFLPSTVLPAAEGTGRAPREAPRGQMAGVERAPLCLALPGRPEDEEEDSEDSDESDEELRCYSVQAPSDESEEEAPPVPVVVAERQARSLRGLLKGPALLSALQGLDRRKKAVSFFDDVTVYLFDQESPTRELGEPLPGAQEPPPAFPARSPGPAPDGSTADEGGAFAWDDDFPLVPAKAALATARGAGGVQPRAAAPLPFSRFSVSPAPASRFSITHVSDLDAEAVGGPAPGPTGVHKEA